MKPSTRCLCEARTSVCYPVAQFDLSRIRLDFAALMDRCAEAVTLEHGLDLDDVLMERFAVVGSLESGVPTVAQPYEVPLPFLADPSALVRSINQGRPADGLAIKELVVRVYLETGAPLFNQAGSTIEFKGPDTRKIGPGDE